MQTTLKFLAPIFFAWSGCFDQTGEVLLEINASTYVPPESSDHSSSLQRIYFSEGWDDDGGSPNGTLLRSQKLDGSDLRTEVKTTGTIWSIALDPEKKKVYWADNSFDAIFVAQLGGAGQTMLYSNPDPYSNPNALALDLENRRMFWSEGRSGSSQIKSAKLDGSDVRTEIASGHTIWSMALDPDSRKIYWADNGSDTISVAKYGGAGQTTLYTNSFGYSNPNALAIDLSQRRIFWSEGVPGTSPPVDGTYINSMRLDGSDARREFLSSGFIWSIAVDARQQKIYWADNKADRIFVAKYGGSSEVVLYGNSYPFSNPNAVAITP